VRLGRTHDGAYVALKLINVDLMMTPLKEKRLQREVEAMQTLQETGNPDARFVKLQDFHSRLSHTDEKGATRDVSLCMHCQTFSRFELSVQSSEIFCTLYLTMWLYSILSRWQCWSLS
jgi:hypothetical protein